MVTVNTDTDIGDIANGYLGYAASSISDIDADQGDVEDAIEDAVKRAVGDRAASGRPRTSTNTVQETAQLLAPKDTGQLAEAITASVPYWIGDTFRISLYVERDEAPHVAYLERNVSPHVITPEGVPNEAGWVDDLAERRTDAMGLPALRIEDDDSVYGVTFTPVVEHPGSAAQDDFLERAGNIKRNDIKNEIRYELLTDVEELHLGEVRNFEFG